jgi:protein-tyrosine-phosphatase
MQTLKKKYKKSITKKRIKKNNNRKTRRTTKNKKRVRGRQRGGSLRKIIYFLFLGICLSHTIYIVCIGNTCRSPYFKTILEQKINNILSQYHVPIIDNHFNGFQIIIDSFGTNPRIQGASMAPMTTQYAIESCKGETQCILKVNGHKSKSLPYSDIDYMSTTNGQKALFIPMNQDVEDSLKQLLIFYNISNPNVKVLKNANIADPFQYQNTPLEKNAYDAMKDDVQNKVDLYIPYILKELGISSQNNEKGFIEDGKPTK